MLAGRATEAGARLGGSRERDAAAGRPRHRDRLRRATATRRALYARRARRGRCRRSTRASACRRSRRWPAACRSWRRRSGALPEVVGDAGAARAARRCPTPGPTALDACARRRSRARAWPRAGLARAARSRWAATARRARCDAYARRHRRARGARADAGRHRRARTGRPADRRRPLPGGAAGRVARPAGATAATSCVLYAHAPPTLVPAGLRGRRARRRRARAARGGSSGTFAARARPRSARRAVRARLHRAARLRRRRSCWPSTTSRSSRTPSGSRAREGLRRRLLTAWSARRAARRADARRRSRPREIVRLHRPSTGARVRVVYLGRARRRSRRRSPRRAPLVLFVGSLFQRRRLDVLIDAFARVAAARPDARLEIVGENRTRAARGLRGAIAARGPRARASAARLGRRRRRSTALYRRGVGVRVPVATTRASASRRSRRWRTAPCRSCSTRRWRARSTATPRWRVADGPTLAADVAAALGRAARRRRGARARTCAAAAGRCWRATAGPTPRAAHARRASRRPPVPEPSLAIVIVSYNVRADLERCLRSLRGAPAAAADDDRRRRQRARPTARSTGCSATWPAVQAVDAGGNLGLRRAPTTSASAPRRASSCCCSTATPWCRRRDRRAGRRRCAPTPAPPPPVRAWSTPTAGPSCRSAR